MAKSTSTHSSAPAPAAAPALIPTPIYNVEGALATASKDLFVSRDQLNRMLPIGEKQQLVQTLDSLARTLNSIRSQITDQLGRRSSAVGKGFRNYGFMMAANQSINNFPELAPNFVSIADFNDVIEDYLFARDVSERMLSLSNDMRDIMNTFGDLGFSFALAYYANVRSIAERTRDKTAVSVFEILRRFFTRKRTPLSEGEEPTEMQVERSLHALLHGKKDGEIIVKNESPTVSGRVHEVIDNTHSPNMRGGVKATIEGKVEE